MESDANEFVPPTYGPDPVIEAYKRDVDETLIIENLKLTVHERLEQLAAFQDFARNTPRGQSTRDHGVMDHRDLLPVLCDAGVEFIVIGGVAAAAHGSARLTRDLDVVYRRTAHNIQRIIDALAPYHPYFAATPPGLPFLWDAETIRRGLNFTLTTDVGAIDLLGEVTGGGTFDNLAPMTVEFRFFDRPCPVLNLERLIQVKRTAGRPKDFEAIAELEKIRDRTSNKPPTQP